jgi:hypothetical protein
MYAIFWTDELGNSGNGQYVLDTWLAREWIRSLRASHPDMKHWAQDVNGRRLSTN